MLISYPSKFAPRKNKTVAVINNVVVSAELKKYCNSQSVKQVFTFVPAQSSYNPFGFNFSKILTVPAQVVKINTGGCSALRYIYPVLSGSAAQNPINRSKKKKRMSQL